MRALKKGVVGAMTCNRLLTGELLTMRTVCLKVLPSSNPPK